MKIPEILEIEDLQKAQAYLKSTASIFVRSYSPKDWSYSPWSNAQFGFKFIDRGFGSTLVLIPGWAADGRIFRRLQLDYNYLLPRGFSPFSFSRELLCCLDNRDVKKVSLLGWSLGCFLAQEFALSCPGRVEDIIFVSARPGFPPEALNEAAEGIEKNRKAFLYKFYANCFCRGESRELSWFRKRLLKQYAEGMELGSLQEGLDYLGRARLNFKALNLLHKRIRFFHGRKDNIAPVAEISRALADWPGFEFITLEDSGHMPFLNPGFKWYFHLAEKNPPLSPFCKGG